MANPENYSREELLAHNQAQIHAWKAEGRSVIDIGPDPLRPATPGPTSPNYAMELQELQGYGGYSRVWVNEPERYLMTTAH